MIAYLWQLHYFQQFFKKKKAKRVLGKKAAQQSVWERDGVFLQKENKT